MWRVGIDVGGTFTDLYAWDDETREQVTSKVLTTRPDRAPGVINAIREAGIPFDRISHLMHGTTTATNALIERDYPDPARVTTEGFRDTIEIGRQHREQLYDPYQVKPRPIIKRRYRYTINERTDAQGAVVRPLQRAEALAIAEKIKAMSRMPSRPQYVRKERQNGRTLNQPLRHFQHSSAQLSPSDIPQNTRIYITHAALDQQC